ncbi:hypothetical protein RCL1_004820 [Eukaryota sp. TZLM3-RCL]
MVTSTAETILKKRKSLHRLRAESTERTNLRRIAKETKPQIKFRRAETFVKDHRIRNREHQRHVVVKKSKSKLGIPSDTKFLLAIRIPGPSAIHKTSLKTLQTLRLSSVYSAVFLQNTAANVDLLRLVEPHVIFGTPTIETVRELLLRRGSAIIEKQVYTINDNRLIEKHLGELGLICIEDVIHEILTCSQNFSQVSAFLAPFQLHGSKAETGREEKLKSGYMGFEINELITRLI